MCVCARARRRVNARMNGHTYAVYVLDARVHHRADASAVLAHPARVVSTTDFYSRQIINYRSGRCVIGSEYNLRTDNRIALR